MEKLMEIAVEENEGRLDVGAALGALELVRIDIVKNMWSQQGLIFPWGMQDPDDSA